MEEVKNIWMVHKTLTKREGTKEECHYYICNIGKEGSEEFERATRAHWREPALAAELYILG